MPPGGAEPPPGPAPALPVDTGVGPPVLLVHGQPGTGSSWWPVAKLLSPDFRVLAPDRPGWGGNPRPATTIAGNAEMLARLVEERLGPEPPPLVVVGHSLGGAVAIELALGWRRLVAGLVLVSSVGVAAALTGMDRLLAVPLLGDGVLGAGAVALRKVVQGTARMASGERSRHLLERANRSAAFRAVMAEADHVVGARERRSFLVEQRALIEETPRIERRLGSLALPCAVVQGGGDHVVGPQAARELAAAIPGAELALRPGAGHLLPFEQPEFVAAVVRRYASVAGVTA